MTYEHINNYLLPHIKENAICVFKNGSQLFCKNCKDYDYTIITRDELGIGCLHINELNIDFFILSASELNRRLKDNQWRYKLAVCLAKADSTNIIYGELPELDIDILSRDYLIKVILPIEKEFAEKTYFAGQGAPKTIVWSLALYYCIINNVFVFTEEQKTQLQICHDNGYNADFAEKLKAQLYAIKESEEV